MSFSLWSPNPHAETGAYQRGLDAGRTESALKIERLQAALLSSRAECEELRPDAEHYRQMIADRHIGAGRTSAVLYESDAIAEINTVGEIAATSPATEESP